MNKIPLVSVVLGSFNRKDLLKLTVESIRKELDNFSHEIIIVDGGSTDGSYQWLAKQKDIVTIIQYNRGEWNGKLIKRRSWGYFMNLAFKCAQGKYICMVSDDCLIIPGAIRNGCELFEKKLSEDQKIGAMAFYWRDWPEQTQYRVGLTLGDKMYVNHGLYLKKALEEVNYIDEETFNFYCADGDVVLKMCDKGYSCIDSPTSFIEHFSHTNTEIRKGNYEKYNADWNAYLAKWKNIFYDPDKKNAGGWIEKEYQDESKTYLHLIPAYKKSKLIKLINRVKNKIAAK